MVGGCTVYLGGVLCSRAVYCVVGRVLCRRAVYCVLG